MPDLSKLNFWSGANYMKRDGSVPQYDITAGAGATVAHDVEHNLGFIPQYEVSGELDGLGIIWARNKLYVGMEGATSPTDPEISAWTTTTKLTLSLYNPTGAQVTRTIYFVIYKDYGTTN